MAVQVLRLSPVQTGHACATAGSRGADMWGFQGVERGGGVSLAWRRLDLLGRKRSRQGRVRGLTGLGCGALRAGFAGLDALVAEEPSDGSEVRHEDDDGIEQGLCDASVRQAELGAVIVTA